MTNLSTHADFYRALMETLGAIDWADEVSVRVDAPLGYTVRVREGARWASRLISMDQILRNQAGLQAFAAYIAEELHFSLNAYNTHEQKRRKEREYESRMKLDYLIGSKPLGMNPVVHVVSSDGSCSYRLYGTQLELTVEMALKIMEGDADATQHAWNRACGR